MGKIDGKNVVVTGASRGIGAEIARLFAAEGGNVICAARTLREGEHPLEGSLEKTEWRGGNCFDSKYIFGRRLCETFR